MGVKLGRNRLSLKKQTSHSGNESLASRKARGGVFTDPTPSLCIQLLGYFAAVSAGLRGRAEGWRPDQFGFFQQGPSVPLGGAVVGGIGGDRVGASVHHTGVESVGHGEGLEVGLESQREGEFIDQVDGGTGDNGATAEVLKTQDWEAEKR